MDSVIQHFRWAFRTKDWKKEAKHAAKSAAGMAPLLTAVIAPLSTLYDIPGLSQRWYTFNGTPVPDPAANLALSAVGLAANLLANALLFFRFSSQEKWWKTAMISSTVCWVFKSIIAILNLGLYGAGTRNNVGYDYSDGFWCAVFSCLIAGFISVFLLFSALVQDEDHTSDSEDIRVQARHFLVTELAFFLFLALEGLILSRLEQWSFFIGVYFSLITATTVGFGSDYAPTTTASRILVFPFAVITIAGLGAQVSALLDFFSARAEARKKRWKAQYEQHQEKIKDDQLPADELIAEMQYLDKTIREEDRLSRLYDLTASLVFFIIFWVVGAAIFSHLEDWSMGNALYFCYVFFLTIGYGDYYPKTSCGRVFWVVYALGAVPIVAGFAVQTISGIMAAVQQKRLENEKVKRGIEPRLRRETTIPIHKGERQAGSPRSALFEDAGDEDGFSPFISHAELVIRRHERYRDRHRAPAIPSTDGGAVTPAGTDSTPKSESSPASMKVEDDAEAAKEEAETLDKDVNAAIQKDAETEPDNVSMEEMTNMLDELLTHSLNLESQARKLIITGLEAGSKGRLLLQADTNLMQRAVALQDKDATPDVTHNPSTTSESTLQQIHYYRETFAKLLVAATRLRKLEGKEQLKFERRTGFPYKFGYPVKGEGL